MVIQWQLVCALLSLEPTFSSQEHFFRSSKAPKEEVSHYETVFPQFKWITHDASQELTVTLNTSTLYYTLKLRHNLGLLSPEFSSRYHDGTGKESIQRGHENCFYHGEVYEEPEWTVVISTCLGLRGSFGPRSDPDLVYHIEPLHHQLGSSDLKQPHVLYLGSEYTNTASGTCGTVGHSDDIHLHKVAHHEQKSQLRRQGSYAIVEWTLVNDNTQYLAFSSNLTLVVLRAIEIANGVDEVYRVQGVRVVVVDVVTWTIEDPIPISTNSHEFLNNFRDYSHNLPQNYDSAMLFTGIEFDGSTIGIAFTATMCESLQNSVGLVQDGGTSLENLISTTAHELGHIFAMDHDTPSCVCEDDTGECIMHDTLSIPPSTTWSSCSVETLFTSLGGPLGLCLGNAPVTTVSDATCGNGIQEKGEACDCGSAEECVDPCCNTTSCQLVAGAKCRASACCLPNCQLKEYGTVCREARARTDCDIEEYCNGYESECPRDTVLQNLTPCMSNQSFCFSGECQTREDQCQYHFETGDSRDECYTQLNTKGTRFGHCGFDDTQYFPCSERDAFCGQLQCDGGFLKTSPGVSQQFNFESFVCTSVTTLVGSDEISPGLVRDGTKCGDGKVCLSTKCVNIRTVVIPPCPIDSTGELCSGNGLCNNENQCSCFVGFTGSSCSEGVNDGRARRKDNAGAIAGAVIAVILIVAVGVGVSAAIVYFVTRSRSSHHHATRSVHNNRAATQCINNGEYHSSVERPPKQSNSRLPAPPRPPPPSRPSPSSAPPKRPPIPSRPAPRQPSPPSSCKKAKPRPAPRPIARQVQRPTPSDEKIVHTHT